MAAEFVVTGQMMTEMLEKIHVIQWARVLWISLRHKKATVSSGCWVAKRVPMALGHTPVVDIDYNNIMSECEPSVACEIHEWLGAHPCVD